MSSAEDLNQEPAESEPAGYYNVVIFSDDSSLVIQFASAYTSSEYRLALARRRDELLAPELISCVDLVLVDEQMATLDTWNIARVVRQSLTPVREIAVVGFVDNLSAQLMLQGRELGVDAFLLKSATGENLAERIGFIARRIPRRTDEQDNSKFLLHAEFLHSLREQIEIVAPQPPTARSGTQSGTNRTGTQSGASGTKAGSGTKGSSTGSSTTGSSSASSRSTRFKRKTGTERGANKAGDRKLPDLTGMTFGKVRVEEEIGRGGGGVVFAGKHTSLDMKVAVKILHPDLAERDPEFAAQFLHEARIAARISDGSVVRVFDCDRDDETGYYYIIMEFVQGSDLQDEIKRAGAIPEERVLEIALETSRCLMAAEEHGIIHRDIKPANILMTHSGQVKVADLGLAKRVQNTVGLGTGRLSSSGRIAKGPLVGTPYYMSPEQIENSPDIDSRTDVYSLGATLYHAATGTVPFTGEDMGEILFHHLHTEPMLITDKKPEVSAEFARIVQKMMAKRPRQRYSSLREVYGVLRDHRDFLVIKHGHDAEDKSDHPKSTRSGLFFRSR